MTCAEIYRVTLISPISGRLSTWLVAEILISKFQYFLVDFCNLDFFFTQNDYFCEEKLLFIQ